MNRRIAIVPVLVLIAGVLLLAGCSKSSDGAKSANIANSTLVDGYNQVEHKGFVLRWKIDGANLDGSVSFATTGWVAVGFAPSDEMKDANIILGYVADGQAVVTDDFGTSKTAHKADSSVGGTDNLIQSAASEKDGVTEVRFVIPLDSGDGKDARLVAGEVTTVILARGPVGSDNTTTYHGADGRETLTVRL